MTTQNTIGYFDNHSDKYDHAREYTSYTAPKVIWELLQKHTTIEPREFWLDLGIGTGLSSTHAKERGLHVVGIDGSQKMLDICAQKEIATVLLKKDISKEKKLYTHDDHFHYVVASCVLYFIEDWSNIFEETSKLLVNGGYFVFNTKSPISKEFSWKETGVSKIRTYMHTHEYIYNMIKKNNLTLIDSRKDFTENHFIEETNPMIETFIVRK